MTEPELPGTNGEFESEITSLDSDPVEDVDSGEEFSRIMQTPKSDRKKHARVPANSNSTPLRKTNTPWSHSQQQQNLATQGTQPTQHTQQLPPLTGSQLHEMMSMYEEEDEDEEDDDNGGKRKNSPPLPYPPGEIEGEGDGHEEDEDEDDDPINTDGVVPDIEEERIMSSEEEIEADITPAYDHVGDSLDSQVTNVSTESGNGAGHLGLEYVDETPMKLLSMPTPTSPYIYVIVKWHKDPHWWPARAERSDWEAKRRKATVTFRLEESGIVDLQEALELSLKPGDTVHWRGRRSPEYTVVKLWSSDKPVDSLATNEGFDRVRLQPQTKPASSSKSKRSSTPKSHQNNTKSIDCAICDISFSNKDVERLRTSLMRPNTINMASKRKTPASTLPRDKYRTRMGIVDPSPLKYRKLQGSPERKVQRSSKHAWDSTTHQGPSTTTTTTKEEEGGSNVLASSATSSNDKSALKSEIEVRRVPEQIDIDIQRPLPVNGAGARAETESKAAHNIDYSDDLNHRNIISEQDRSRQISTPQRSPTKLGAKIHNSSNTRSPTRTSPNKASIRTSPSRAVAASTRKVINPMLFSEALFTVSISNSNREKARLSSRIIDLIEKHGGVVLREGISQKVQLSELQTNVDGGMPDLEHDFGDATFAAVLADNPRRTLKYLEMLALGWPCLHYRYLEDCIEQNQVLDWKPYLLPAGDLNLSRRKMVVSSDVSAFHQRWLKGASLNEQFTKRKVTFRCSVPLCILGRRSTVGDAKMILAALAAPRYRAWFYTNIKTVPSGSLVVEIEGNSDTERVVIETDPETLYQMKHYAALDATICKNSDWFAQCIISGDIV